MLIYTRNGLKNQNYQTELSNSDKQLLSELDNSENNICCAIDNFVPEDKTKKDTIIGGMTTIYKHSYNPDRYLSNKIYRSKSK